MEQATGTAWAQLRLRPQELSILRQPWYLQHPWLWDGDAMHTERNPHQILQIEDLPILMSI